MTLLYVAAVATLAPIGVAMDIDAVRQLAIVGTYPTGVVLFLAPLLILLGSSTTAWLDTATVALLPGLALVNAFAVRALLRRWAGGGRAGSGVERRLTGALLAGHLPVTPMAGPRGMVRSPPVRERGFVPGLLTGVVPQAMLLVCVVGLTIAASTGADPELAYLVYPILSALLAFAGVSVLAGLACTLGQPTRQFGKGLLLGAGTPAGIVAGYLAVVLH